jgi:hypothetical protein
MADPCLKGTLCMTNSTLTGVDNQWANGCGLGHGARQHPQRILGAVTGQPDSRQAGDQPPHTRFQAPMHHLGATQQLQPPGARIQERQSARCAAPTALWYAVLARGWVNSHAAAPGSSPPPHSLLQNQRPQHHPTGSRTAGAPGASPAQATAAMRCFPATAREQPNAV